MLGAKTIEVADAKARPSNPVIIDIIQEVQQWSIKITTFQSTQAVVAQPFELRLNESHRQVSKVHARCYNATHQWMPEKVLSEAQVLNAPVQRLSEMEGAATQNDCSQRAVAYKRAKRQP